MGNGASRSHDVPVTTPALPAEPMAGVLLLVEDDPDQAFLVRRRLSEQLPQLEIVHLTTAAAATARLASGDVLCVVLDLTLPDAKGLEAVSAVRAADPTVPIVVLTGLDSDELGRQAVQLGAQDYLVKGRHAGDAVGRSVTFALERTKRQVAEQSQALLAGRLQLVLEASAEGICLIDDDGRMGFANPAAAAILGDSAENLVGQLFHDFHLCPAGDCGLAEELSSGVQVDAGEQPFRAADGRVAVLEVRARPPQGLASDAMAVINLTDVTSRRRVQDALAERETQLIEAQRLAQLGSWEWDLTSDVVVWSREMYRVTGLARESVPQNGRAFESYAELVPQADRSELELLFQDWTAARQPVLIVHRFLRPDGETRWLQCRASMIEETGSSPLAPARRLVGTVQDVTDQKVAEDALAHQALHDTLTGLPNRALLLDRLERALADRSRGNVAVVFMDLDRFKWVNDSLSHAAGDQLLVEVSRRLTGLLRSTDTVARLGGDEFVLVSEHFTSEHQVFAGIDRLSAELSRPYRIEGRDLVVTTSMGVAIARPDAVVDAESLIRDADTAMYRAKENGRARYEIFDEAMRLRASQRLEIQSDLRQALHAEAITPWFQPIVDLRTGLVTGCEALARWNHPTRGLLMPDAFIPHAEETGAIVVLGGQVLRRACIQVAAWNRARPPHRQLSLSVNVSARQLGSADLIDTVRQALEESGLAPEQLCLEVTESVVMEDVAVSGAVLGQLRELRIRTAVDDFGTGYSSLAYLLSLPVDVLKVDRSFVEVLDLSDGPAVAIVRAIAALAATLGMGVVAEGVETQDQLTRLSELSIQSGQGYLWGKAVPAAQATWACDAGITIPPARVAAGARLVGADVDGR
jgi:diguanylate cyclase (GGDEF)-like protein/PAS domain S-box-containing protein